MSGNGHSSGTAGKILYRIGEVSRMTATKPFVLRYWETEFPTLQPVKSPSGHRLYRREDIETVLEIRHLLYEEGFTIAGARKHLQDRAGNGGELPAAKPSSEALRALPKKLLLDLREELRAILTLLKER
jgi:DNA-binding transcriptional MerR regulator